MKRARTFVNVGFQENLTSDNTPDAGSTLTTSTHHSKDIGDTVEQLRADLRQKTEELLQMDVELRVAQTNFAELEVCSREVEQELENEVSRLSRLNRELENENRNLEQGLQNVLGRVNSSQVETTSMLDVKVAKLQKQLQCLEQENDDLQMFVLRLEATNEDLGSELERSQEETIFAQHELEVIKEEVAKATMQSRCQIQDLTTKVKEYKALVNIGKLNEADDVCTGQKASTKCMTWIHRVVRLMTPKNRTTMKANMQMHSPHHDDEVVQLRQRLRHLEQENDDLQSHVRRLEATEEDLSHKLECTEEKAVFVQQELDILKEKHEQAATDSANHICDLTAKLQVYENVVNRLLSVVGISIVPQEAEGKELEVERGSEETDEGAGHDDEDNLAVNGSTAEVNPVTRTATTTPATERKWLDMVDHLRDALKTKTEQLQLTESSYEEFMTVSYEVEKALVNDNEDLKRLNEELYAKNVQLLKHQKTQQHIGKLR